MSGHAMEPNDPAAIGAMLSPEDLLAGASATFDVGIPDEILQPGRNRRGEPGGRGGLTVRLRPMTIGAFQLIMRAAKDDAGLIPLLMVKESLIEPALTFDQVKRLHLGLIEFLVERIREISGLTEKKKDTTD